MINGYVTYYNRGKYFMITDSSEEIISCIKANINITIYCNVEIYAKFSIFPSTPNLHLTTIAGKGIGTCTDTDIEGVRLSCIKNLSAIEHGNCIFIKIVNITSIRMCCNYVRQYTKIKSVIWCINAFDYYCDLTEYSCIYISASANTIEVSEKIQEFINGTYDILIVEILYHSLHKIFQTCKDRYSLFVFRDSLEYIKYLQYNVSIYAQNCNFYHSFIYLPVYDWNNVIQDISEVMINGTVMSKHICQYRKYTNLLKHFKYMPEYQKIIFKEFISNSQKQYKTFIKESNLLLNNFGKKEYITEQDLNMLDYLFSLNDRNLNFISFFEFGLQKAKSQRNKIMLKTWNKLISDGCDIFSDKKFRKAFIEHTLHCPYICIYSYTCKCIISSILKYKYFSVDKELKESWLCQNNIRSNDVSWIQSNIVSYFNVTDVFRDTVIFTIFTMMLKNKILELQGNEDQVDLLKNIFINKFLPTANSKELLFINLHYMPSIKFIKDTFYFVDFNYEILDSLQNYIINFMAVFIYDMNDVPTPSNIYRIELYAKYHLYLCNLKDVILLNPRNVTDKHIEICNTYFTESMCKKLPFIRSIMQHKGQCILESDFIPKRSKPCIISKDFVIPDLPMPETPDQQFFENEIFDI
jgi:hypothetical protein